MVEIFCNGSDSPCLCGFKGGFYYKSEAKKKKKKFQFVKTELNKASVVKSQEDEENKAVHDALKARTAGYDSALISGNMTEYKKASFALSRATGITGVSIPTS